MKHSSRIGLTRDGPRLLRRVNGQSHAREEDHEAFNSPNPKRQCLEGDKEERNIPTQSRDTHDAFSSNLQKKRISASPISLDSDEDGSGKAARGVGKPQPTGHSEAAPLNTKTDNNRITNGSKTRSSATRASSTQEPQPDDDPVGFHNSPRPKSIRPQKTYGSQQRTKNIHVEARPEPQDKKASKVQVDGFHTPRSIQLQRPGSISNSEFKMPGKKAAQDLGDNSDDTPSDDSGTSLDRVFREARGEGRFKEGPEKAASKRSTSPGNGFKNPSDYARKDADSSLDSKEYKAPIRTSVNGSDSSLSSPPDSAVLDYAEQSVDLPLASSQLLDDSPYAICPLCDETVDRSFLDEFSNYARRMSIRKQTLFCHAHQRRSAIEEYKAAGYPEVNWKRFPRRLKRYHGHIDEILDQKKESWCRKELEERAKSGTRRTLRQTAMATDDESSMHKFVPGYYGTKGARLM